MDMISLTQSSLCAFSPDTWCEEICRRHSSQGLLPGANLGLGRLGSCLGR